MEQKSYGKPLFFSKLQMIPVKVEPAEEVKPDGGNQQVSASHLRRDVEASTGRKRKKE